MKLELKNHQVWQDISEILDKIDVNALVAEHLEACDYKIWGYWDENDQFYEEIILPRSILSKLVSSFIGISDSQRWIKLNFVLQADNINSGNQAHDILDRNIGSLTLVYDDQFQFVDEIWEVNTNSSLVISYSNSDIPTG
jgi:hypothetical protein